MAWAWRLRKQNHPMAFKLLITDNKVNVFFPYNVNGLSGVRVDNTAQGLEHALAECEKAWKESKQCQ